MAKNEFSKEAEEAYAALVTTPDPQILITQPLTTSFVGGNLGSGYDMVKRVLKDDALYRRPRNSRGDLVALFLRSESLI